MGVVSTPAFQLSLNRLAFNVKTLQEVFSVIGCILTSTEKNWKFFKNENIGVLKRKGGQQRGDYGMTEQCFPGLYLFALLIETAIIWILSFSMRSHSI